MKSSDIYNFIIKMNSHNKNVVTCYSKCCFGVFITKQPQFIVFFFLFDNYDNNLINIITQIKLTQLFRLLSYKL